VLLLLQVTVIACCVTTDTVLLAVVGRAAVGPSAIGPVSDGVGFVTFFYAALTTIETTCVLTYHLVAGEKRKQACAMGSAAGIQLIVTTTCVCYTLCPNGHHVLLSLVTLCVFVWRCALCIRRFFLILPSILLSNTYKGGGGSQGGISTSLFILLVLLNALMFLVEMFIMAVRIAIARKKWSELHPCQHVGVEAVPASAEKV
jgi:hypothetical protein